MSEEEEGAKTRMEYTGPGERPQCSNCRYYQSRKEKGFSMYFEWIEFRVLRCSRGGFEVSPAGICKRHEAAEKR